MRATTLVVPDCAGSPLLGATVARWLGLAAGARIFIDAPADTRELIARVRTADTVLHYFQAARLDAEVLAEAQPARIVVMGPAGDSVDTVAACRIGTQVYETAGLAAAGVAEYTLALMLTLARQVACAYAAMRNGAWEPRFGRELATRRLGVVGLGKIGLRVAHAALALGMAVSAWSRKPHSVTAGEIHMTSLDELLRESDVVSLHARLGPDSRGLIDRRRIALLKADALLINTARAGLLDMAALRVALLEGRIGGAALDVFEVEPLAPDDPLRSCQAVLTTPHMGWMTHETLERFVAAAVAFVCRDDATLVTRVV